MLIKEDEFAQIPPPPPHPRPHHHHCQTKDHVRVKCQRPPLKCHFLSMNFFLLPLLLLYYYQYYYWCFIYKHTHFFYIIITTFFLLRATYDLLAIFIMTEKLFRKIPKIDSVHLNVTISVSFSHPSDLMSEKTSPTENA